MGLSYKVETVMDNCANAEVDATMSPLEAYKKGFITSYEKMCDVVAMKALTIGRLREQKRQLREMLCEAEGERICLNDAHFEIAEMLGMSYGNGNDVSAEELCDSNIKELQSLIGQDNDLREIVLDMWDLLLACRGGEMPMRDIAIRLQGVGLEVV